MRYLPGSFIGLLLLTSVTAAAGDPSGSAPLPTQIGTSKRVFLSNMGGECQNFNGPGIFHTGQALHHGQVSAAVPTAYDALYTALKDWGHFELVLAPSDADLVFQIHVACPSLQEGHPVLDLQILDPKSRISLWGFSEVADPADLQKNRDVNFERALNRLTQDIKAFFRRADATPVTDTK